MKSAKSILEKARKSLLAFFVLTSCVLTSCGGPSFVPNQDENGTSPPDDLPTMAVPNSPTEILFYNSYTGLACDEEIASCRPISVCIGNFDGKLQNGLSNADILIEAPVENGETRLWMIASDYRSIPALSSISSTRTYMLPISNAFGAISVFSGNLDKSSEPYPEGDYLDYSVQNESEAFWTDGAVLYSSGARLDAAIAALGYEQTLPSSPILPYTLSAKDSDVSLIGNPINDIKIEYGVGKETLFTYEKSSSQYLARRHGAPYAVDENGSALTFSNVLILFHNVSDYHTETESYFTLDALAGGSGYCYTGGGVLRITWKYDEDGSLLFLNESGEKLTLNRGRTYISMMKVTDAQKVIAK